MCLFAETDEVKEETETIRQETKKPRLFRCCDRLCGGTDCANCYPALEYSEQEDEA